jgi:uracil-DNA glycosylase
METGPEYIPYDPVKRAHEFKHRKPLTQEEWESCVKASEAEWRLPWVDYGLMIGTKEMQEALLNSVKNESVIDFIYGNAKTTI